MSDPHDGLKGGVWHVARECAGLAEAGGLKDVVAGLSAALASAGVPASVVLLRYGFIDLESLGARKLPGTIRLSLPEENQRSPAAEETVQVYRLQRDRVRVYFLDSPRTHAKRAIYTYTGADEAEDPQKKRGTGHWDAHHLNLILQRGALELALIEGAPELFHCHDGHAALLPVLLREHPRYARALASSRALITIHNAGWGYHQEIYDRVFAEQLTELPQAVLERGVLNDAVDPLLLGGMYAPVTTVSEGYAAEIASGAHEALTGGLGAAYASRGIALHGITNGVDPDGFDPRRPKATGLRHRFDPSRGDLKGKIRCRALLLDAFNEASVSREAPASRGEPHTDLFAGVECFGSLDPADEIPLFTFVGRLTAQKGLDVLIAALRELFRARVPLRVLVLGQGDRTLEERLLRLSREVVAAGRMGVLLGFNTLLSKYVYASGDFFVIPSEYEPCGLTDYYAQLMGSLPVVHAVGGLIKVRQGQTGYTYREHSAEALCDAILEALGDWDLRRGHLESMRRKAFAEIFELHTWGRVLSDHYLPLYGNKALWNHRSD